MKLGHAELGPVGEQRAELGEAPAFALVIGLFVQLALGLGQHRGDVYQQFLKILSAFIFWIPKANWA